MTSGAVRSAPLQKLALIIASLFAEAVTIACCRCMEMNSVQLVDCFGTTAAVLDTSALKCILPEKVSRPLWILCGCVQQ